MVLCVNSNRDISGALSKMLITFVLLSSVRDKKDLPLDHVDQKDQDGSFDYQ